jgi:flagellar basal-body rod modification protein FlgD
MPTIPIDATSAQQTSAAPALSTSGAAPGGKLGKDEFLRLLATEMRSQDPLDPASNTEMIAQLAQFSALEQMANVSSEIALLRQQSALLQSFTLTGEDVVATLDDSTVVEGKVEAVYLNGGTLLLQINGELLPIDRFMTFERKPAEEPAQDATTPAPAPVEPGIPE